MEKQSISLLLALLIASLSVLQGCGKEEHQKAASQVVAKVNGDEISVHQINYVLTRSQGINPENADQAKKEILDKLIDQQLAIRQAEAAKLDRDPGVMQNIEASRRDILARAYLEKIVAAQTKPTVEEARKYYGEHPELFSQRRVYNLQEIMAPGAPIADIRQLVSQSKSMQEVAAGLKSRDIKFAANAGVRPAEQLPLNVLSQLQSAKDGQTVVVELPQGAMVLHVLASQTQPVAEAEALPRIQQFMANQRSGEAVANELKKLRSEAKIEQVGEIAVAPKAEPAKAAPAAPAASAMDDKNVAKGVAGLK
jgi:EpsD family peptidyl-prolyl cis-trans isomerase